jgi:uncharacterized RDD family membrane protein YckC
MGSALLNPPPPDQATCEPAAHSHAATATPPHALRLEVAERLAEHRHRRSQLHPQPPAPRPAEPPTSPAAVRSARIAASVAERFARSPSYRAFLAAEAERATQRARAAAEIAELNAQAVAQAEQQLLDALYPDAAQDDQPCEYPAQEQTLWPEDELSPATEPGGPRFSASSKRVGHRADARSSSAASPTRSKPANRSSNHAPATASAPAASQSPGLTVCLFEDATFSRPASQPSTLTPKYGTPRHDQADDAEARALDDEITFRHAPVFEEPAGPPMPLPANLIEFPRQLVAPRKVRPRYAEGPLREDDDPAPGGAQLRIFEVDADQISTTPDVAETPTPQWTSLWLDTTAEAAAHTSTSPSAVAAGLPTHYVDVAPRRYPAAISCRLRAAAIDASLILAGFLASAATVAVITLHAAPAGTRIHVLLARATAIFTGRTELQPSLAFAAIAAALVFLYILYQLLFFSFSEATPGMRRARIALCTFADENPTRPAMRRRILAVLLSACSLGLGFLWATLDEDRLTWHDLISHIYQRSY